MKKTRDIPKFRKHQRPSFLLLGLLLLGFPILLAEAFLLTLNVGGFQEELAAQIRQRAGRTVTFGGPLRWDFAFDREAPIRLISHDLEIANPDWASRKDMARIGQARFHLSLRDLLFRRIVITAVDLTGTEMQLETGPNDQNNWSLPKDAPQSKEEKLSFKPRRLTLLHSKIGFQTPQQPLRIFSVPSIQFTSAGDSTNIRLQSLTPAGLVASVDIEGQSLSKLSRERWPFNMIATIGPLRAEARGQVKDQMRILSLDEFVVRAGDSSLRGALSLSFAQSTPYLNGVVTSKNLDLTDFATWMPARPETKRLFSKTPYAFEELKTINADVDFMLQQITWGLTKIDSLSARVALHNGDLAVAPISGLIGGGVIDGKIKLDTTQSPARLAFKLHLPHMQMSRLLTLGGLEAMIEGKTQMAVDITSHGWSPFDFAAHANGTVNILMDSGKMAASAPHENAGAIMRLIAPSLYSLSQTGLRCLAARYVISDGIVDTKGLLIDTETTTITGQGYINLPDEQIGMSLYTRPKTIGIESLLPSMQLSGALLSPDIQMDTGQTVQKLTDMVTQQDNHAEGVPVLLDVLPGRNACAVTLDTPHERTVLVPTSTVSSPLTPGFGGSGLTEAIKNYGHHFMQLFLGE